MDSQATGQQQMPMMKWMMYLMPVMFLFFFNDYASGLCYYYLISTLFTLLQTFIFRMSINDEKLLAKLKANSGKPQKKSGFMERLEKMQKEQMARQREMIKQQQKRRWLIGSQVGTHGSCVRGSAIQRLNDSSNTKSSIRRLVD